LAAKIGYCLQKRGWVDCASVESTDYDCEGSHAGVLLRW